jgi:transposase
MRGDIDQQPNMFAYVGLEERIPQNHPLRKLRKIVDKALKDLDSDFDALYAKNGRASIPPEFLIRAQLLQIIYSIRSERLLMETIEYNLLFRWFIGLGIDDAIWDHSTFSQNRDRLMTGKISEKFFQAIKAQAEAKKLLSREHFSLDGTLIDAAASMKSFRPIDERPEDDPRNHPDGGRNPEVDFHGEKRSNETHRSTTDPEARLAKKAKGQASKIAYSGHLLTENRNGLIVDAEVETAHGKAERETGLKLLERNKVKGRHRTVGADKGYDTKDFITDCRKLDVTPHVAAKQYSSLDGRTLNQPGYKVSLRKRKLIEQCFGWLKDFGLMRKVRHRGKQRVREMFLFSAAAYNLIRMKNLLSEG